MYFGVTTDLEALVFYHNTLGSSFPNKEGKTRFLGIEAANLDIEILSNYLNTHFSELLPWPVDNCNLSMSLWLDLQHYRFS